MQSAQIAACQQRTRYVCSRAGANCNARRRCAASVTSVINSVDGTSAHIDPHHDARNRSRLRHASGQGPALRPQRRGAWPARATPRDARLGGEAVAAAIAAEIRLRQNMEGQRSTPLRSGKTRSGGAVAAAAGARTSGRPSSDSGMPVSRRRRTGSRRARRICQCPILTARPRRRQRRHRRRHERRPFWHS